MFPKLNDALHTHLVQVGPMRQDELREAIERPAYLVGCEVEPALSERLLADVEGQSGALPLLQFALKEVWQKRDVRKLTLDAYLKLGGVQGVLEKRANEVFDSLDVEQKAICKEIFQSLVQLGEGAEDTKRRVAYRELLPGDPEQAARFRDVIEKLTDPDVRLITTDRRIEPRPAGANDAMGVGGADEGGVEVAHEALIRGWKQLREWINEDRAVLRTKRRLTEAAREWAEAPPEKRGRVPLPGARLAVASEWARGKLARAERERLPLGQSECGGRDPGQGTPPESSLPGRGRRRGCPGAHRERDGPVGQFGPEGRRGGPR